ncbi:alpha/beta fold hydrolase [Bacillus cytotoxicus]|uniref:Alpha/beta hydrolase fold n=1 Tax=Bacillus cytotoxicus (strain DSM 22905 / CIP 110041 / 391-98 / NVH 391-98) TaxID=315749 RepID=A7GPF9_BACCN|nr:MULTISPECIES: alpha/beta hydrolase [Bacillus cereus group]ABS22017.1 alpha/beta hydrolase fold [Bacillus cytotoxicus NVH 391-98]AWC28619.1 alpha/beta hydrolase [Bacillus cytotoxicus]AWC32642.1 alpha/beta hydrolase [Bacillus cytotoxicus]AWC36670.1 alpha/beta hydrolase [Bacillus cytotoxicus]AWC39997.1 alpha/beta hydrolase [Bacillus cytotoxicus]
MPMLDVDGSSLYYVVKGKGTPILFIHPPILTHSNFEYQIEELSKHFKVIAFDIRGHGKSLRSKEPITYSLIAKDMKVLLDHLKIKNAFICGYSTGSSVALEFLLTYAERSLGGILIGGMSEVRQGYLKNKISLGVTLAKIKAISFLAFAISWGNSNKVTLFKKLFRESRNGNAKNIEEYYRYSLHYNCTHQLQNIYLPVLLVYGEKDKTFYSHANVLHEKLPYNELRFIHHTKHQIPTKAATELNQMIGNFIYTHTEALEEKVLS